MLRCCLAIALLLAATAAHADAVVNLCGTDTQAGAPGQTNLANAIEAGGLITFDCGGSATIKFTRGHEILRTTTIDGGGRITLDGDRNGMFFGIESNRMFRLKDITIVNGGSPPSELLLGLGGVILGSLRVELVGTEIRRSQWPVWLFDGDLRVVGSRFIDNDGVVLQARNVDVGQRSQISNNRGSPIYAFRGRVVIADSEFSSNAAATRVENCVVAISDSRFNNHTSIGQGGALDLNCDATIENSEFRSNRAVHGGAIFVGSTSRTLALRAVKFADNVATETGGAISIENGGSLDLSLRHITFTGNRARQGGALMLEQAYGDAKAIVGSAVAFIGNEAREYGGAIFALNAAIKINRGLFIENRAGTGGGAVVARQQGARATELTNSILVRNAAGNGAAFWGNSAAFINTTIYDNGNAPVVATAAPTMPAVPIAGAPTTFPIRFLNTIIAGTSAGCGPLVGESPYIDDGNNLQDPGMSCGPTLASGSPLLGPYYVPLPWSPAVNAGSVTVCAAPPIANKDFYNVRRPLRGPACAIGAVEADISHLVYRWQRRGGVGERSPTHQVK